MQHPLTWPVHVLRLQILTFDNRGISGHPNHCSASGGVRWVIFNIFMGRSIINKLSLGHVCFFRDAKMMYSLECEADRICSVLWNNHLLVLLMPSRDTAVISGVGFLTFSSLDLHTLFVLCLDLWLHYLYQYMGQNLFVGRSEKVN